MNNDYDVMEYDAETDSYSFRKFTDEEKAEDEERAKQPVTP